MDSKIESIFTQNKLFAKNLENMDKTKFGAIK